MHLFNHGLFRLAGGGLTPWKIDCDALTDADWLAITATVVPSLPRFGSVEGVPTGGLKFAAALEPFAEPGGHRLPCLIVDDVLTTGGSIEQQRGGRHPDGCVGLVLFARGPLPSWVRAVFTYGLRDPEKT